MRILPKSNFWKNVFTLSAGTALAQLIPVLISPILTRLYSPEQFGVYGLYFSCTMVLSVLICGRYEMAILLPDRDEDRINVLMLCFLIALSITGLLFVAVLIWKDWFTEILNNPSIKPLLIFIPLSVFLIGIFQPLNYWANRKKQYHQLSISRVSRSLSASVSGMTFGVSSLKKSGLILADLIGQIISCFYLFHKIWKQTTQFHQFISIAEIKKAAHRYKRFPQYHVLSGLFEKASGNAPIILLTILFSSTDAGFFALALRVISAPVALVAISIGDVFRQEASESYSKTGNCHEIFLNTFKKLSLIGVPSFILGFVIIKFLFIPVFGDNWKQAGFYSEIMCVMFFLQFILSPLSSMFIIAEKQHVDMINNIILFVLCLAVFWSAKYFFNNATLAIIFYSIVYSLKYIIEFLFSLKYSKGNTYAKQ